MAKQEHLEILLLGPEVWNQWYRHTSVLADLEGVNLACTVFSGIRLTGARLRAADLRYCELQGADLRGADLTGAKLARANLSGANLSEVMGLTQEKVNGAIGDHTTVLPGFLRRPAHWIS